MGAEQGDKLGTETNYVHPDHPEWGTRPAYTATDRVNLEARGWVVKTSGGRKTPAPAPATSADASS